ncbi:MAG: hypothetical protein ACJA0T_000970 [Colwellia sp.]|jgi:hypothetical protein
MNELSKTFSELFECYSKQFKFEIHTGSSRAEFMKSVSTQTRGVYSVWLRDSDRPIYIGCAGKISKKGELTGNTIKTRMFQANTPYHFSKTSDDYFFGPTTATVPPKGYDSAYPIKDLIIKLIIITNNTAPAALEHILLQGFANEYASLPQANQKL